MEQERWMMEWVLKDANKTVTGKEEEEAKRRSQRERGPRAH